MTRINSRMRATILGFCAVLLWAILALCTVMAGQIPPLQLSALCFAVGGGLGLIWIAFRPGGWQKLRGHPPVVWLVGIGGLFGYHLSYFTALQNAPAAQASLIAYLWPLLIVLFSGLLPGETLRPGHVLGAIIAFFGAALVIAGPGVAFSEAHLTGYLAASACAVLWSGYSVLSRRFGETPTEMVAVYCLAAAALSLVAHLLLERTIWPETGLAWLAVFLLGLGPVGGAFYLWDMGVKQGDIQTLGVLSYAAPLLSTLALIFAGFAAASFGLLVAAGLITLGALIASRAGRSEK